MDTNRPPVSPVSRQHITDHPPFTPVNTRVDAVPAPAASDAAATAAPSTPTIALSRLSPIAMRTSFASPAHPSSQLSDISSENFSTPRGAPSPSRSPLNPIDLDSQSSVHIQNASQNASLFVTPTGRPRVSSPVSQHEAQTLNPFQDTSILVTPTGRPPPHPPNPRPNIPTVSAQDSSILVTPNGRPPPSSHDTDNNAISHVDRSQQQNTSSRQRDHNYAVPSLMDLQVPPPQPSLPHIPDLPPLSEVLQTYISTLDHIPRARRDSCAIELSIIHEKIVSDPSVYNWTLLLIFAKCVLFTPLRGGRGPSRNLPSVIDDRLKLWSQGRFRDLWENAKSNQQKVQRRQQRRSSEGLSRDINAKRALSKARAGQYRNALQALGSEGLADDSQAVLQALSAKHPQAPAPILPDGPVPDTIPIPDNIVRASVLSFNADTAPGPSSFRANYFKDLFSAPNPNNRTRYFSSLTSLVNSMNRAKVPAIIQPFLFAATLHAAKKKNNGIRPIAVGDVFARLTSKCLAAILAEDAISVFGPHQLGIKIRGGCESVIHAASTTLRSGTPIKDRYVLQVDLENAYNNIDRAHFLAETRQRLPILSSWAELAYGNPSHLFYRGHCLLSSVGAKQGDAVAGYLFGAGLQPVIEEINRAAPNLVANMWIMDDGTVIGDIDSLRSVVDVLEREGPSKGLLLNKSKSSIWVGEHFPSTDDPLSRGIPKGEPSGIQLLGSPIGSNTFMEASVNERVTKIESSIVTKLSSLGDPQIQLALLRSCLSLPTLMYTLRTCVPSSLQQAYARFDDIQREAADDIIGFPLTDSAWAQATLPVSMGGLGLKSAVAHAPAAYLSSLVQSKDVVDKLLPSFSHRHDLDASLSIFRAAVTSLPPSALEKLDFVDGDFSQKNLSHLIDSDILSSLLKDAAANLDRRTAARLLSLGLPQAGAFLNAIPNPTFGLSINPELFRTSLRYRLGLRVYNSSQHQCPACGRDSDAFGDHTITCASEYERIHRHDIICDAIYDIAKHAGLSPVSEARLIANSQSRPGDIFLPNWRSRQTAFDVAVTSPLSQSALPQSSSTPGAAIQMMKSRKMTKHFRPCQSNGVTFVPLVVETLGGWDS